MNLALIVNGITSIVHGSVLATVKRSTGYTVNADKSVTPTFETVEDVRVNRQPMTSGDLRMVEGLNLTGQKSSFYVWGDYGPGQSQDGTGGDLFTLPDGTRWLAVYELENWFAEDGWKRLAMVRQ